MSQPQESKLVETEDESDIGALVVKAAEQLQLMGNAEFRASVRFAMDDQWFRATLQMIDASEGTK